jgi:hypothetical protein
MPSPWTTLLVFDRMALSSSFALNDVPPSRKGIRICLLTDRCPMRRQWCIPILHLRPCLIP